MSNGRHVAFGAAPPPPPGPARKGPYVDPLEPLFDAITFCQEKAVPLLMGVLVAMIMANADWDTYQYYFQAECHGDGGHRRLSIDATDINANDCVCMTNNECHADPAHRYRFLGEAFTAVGRGLSTAAAHDDHATDDHATDDHAADPCACERWLFIPCALFSHAMTVHFIANDLIMAVFFGLATKEVTEAVLPGGSLNPISKAINPLFTTIGGVFGPIAFYFMFLKIFIEVGAFDSELESGLTEADLSRGWGVVTATDIVLAWLIGRVVFGDGHPAIDYLLLLAVADDLAGIVIIAVFYPDPNNPVKIQWMGLVILAMFLCWIFRKWHYRRPRKTNQPWQPYVLIAGAISWVGFIKAHLHPALALVPIVPFMPGPEEHVLDAHHEHHDQVHDEIEKLLRDLGISSVDLMLGALGGGTTDSTPAIMAAAAAVPSSNGDAPAPAEPPQAAPGLAFLKKILAPPSPKRTTPNPDAEYLNANPMERANGNGMPEEKSASEPNMRMMVHEDVEVGTDHLANGNGHVANGNGNGHLPHEPTGLPRKVSSRIHMPHFEAIEKAKSFASQLKGRVLPKNSRSRRVQKKEEKKERIRERTMTRIMSEDEEDDEDDEHEIDHHDSTLCEFEHFWKVYVDFGLFIFSLVNAGVRVNGIGAMTFLILGSLVLGKVIGVIVCYHICCHILGFPAPLGVRHDHVHMIGLMAALGLTVALFVSEVAFSDPKLKGDCKLGALLSGGVLGACYVVSMFHNYKTEDSAEVVRGQVREEFMNTSMGQLQPVPKAAARKKEMTRSASFEDASSALDNHQPEVEVTRTDLVTSHSDARARRMKVLMKEREEMNNSPMNGNH